MIYLNIFGDIWHAIKALIQNIVDLLVGIFDFIVDVASFLGHMIQEIITVGAYIADAFKLAGDCINLLPNFIKVFAIVTVAVLVAFQVLGRTGGAK